jgi:basic amino acid/polyamine antiporter, APA family
VLPAAVAGELGAAGPLAYVVCGVALLLVTVSFAIAGSRVSRTGGAYAYIDAAFGPFPGYVAGVLAWLSGALASAGLIAALAAIATRYDSRLQGRAAQILLIIVIYAGPVALNLLGIRTAARLIVGATVAKLGTLILFLLLATPAVSPSNLRWTGPVDPAHLGRAAILAFFALAGMEAAIGASGEIREPRRTVPVALLTGMVFVVGLYVAVHVVAQGVLGAGLPAAAAPLADAVGAAGHGRALMLAGMAFSMLGLLAGSLLGSSRILFAFARDGILPAVVATLHPRTRIPFVAVLIQASIAVILAATRTFVKLAILASITNAILYGMACAAAIVLARTATRQEGVPLPVSVQRLLAAGGVACMLWLGAQSTWSEFGAIAVTILAAALVFAVTARVRGTRAPAGWIRDGR